MSRCSAFAPASIGNVSVGFDTLGLAVEPLDGNALGDRVTVEASPDMRLEVSGDYAGRVPHDGNNLVFQAGLMVQQWLEAQGAGRHCWTLLLDKGLPVASGTGSSAASAVAAIRALSDWCRRELEQTLPAADQWRMLGRLEALASGSAHLDNLAPAMLGGLVLCPLHAEPRPLPVFPHWRYVLAYSGQSVPTREARKVMPRSYTGTAVVRQMRRLAAVIDGLHRRDEACVLAHLEDELAEPYRAGLIEGYAECRRELLRLGAGFVGISGSGPCFFAVAESDRLAEKLAGWLGDHIAFKQGGFIKLCRVYQRRPDRIA